MRIIVLRSLTFFRSTVMDSRDVVSHTIFVHTFLAARRHPDELLCIVSDHARASDRGENSRMDKQRYPKRSV